MSDQFFLEQVLPWIFLVAGTALLAMAARQTLQTAAFLKRARETTGRVVSLKTEPPRDAGEAPTYRPVVEYTTAAGQRVRFESMTASNPPAQPVGGTVAVLYDPAAPSDGRIKSFTSLWLPVILLDGLGTIFAGLGAAFLIFGIPT